MPEVNPEQPIRSHADLVNHLHQAAQLEISTIAIGAGDQITFYDRTFISHYPGLMLHRLPDLELHLEPCTKDLMDRIFMPLELHEKYDAPPQPGRYNTIGQFYKSIEDGFRYLADYDPEFWSQTPDSLKYQYTSTYWNYQGGGEPVVVSDLKSAMSAMKTIVEQREGIDPSKAIVPTNPVSPQPGLNELSHYAKFKRIRDGVDVIGVV